MTRGGARPGSGRPRGDREASAFGYRFRARDAQRADKGGIPRSDLIDCGLDLLAALEDHATLATLRRIASALAAECERREGDK